MSFTLKFWLTNLLVLVIFIIDRILKLFFLKNPGADRVFVSNLLTFNLDKNPGMAFGINLPSIILIPIVILVIVVLIYILINAYKEKDLFFYSVLLLIIVGAISNIIDRMKYGSVIDYIDVPFFTVFNLADAMITVGVFILLVDRLLVKSKKD